MYVERRPNGWAFFFYERDRCNVAARGPYKFADAMAPALKQDCLSYFQSAEK
jgi:hypothetical protein